MKSRLLVVFALVAAAVATPSLLSVRALAAPDVPVVFIPGFAGSKLKLAGKDGEVLWGDLGSVLQRFDKLDFRVSPPKAVEATGVLDRVGVFGPFTVRQYDDLLQTIQELEYRPGVSLFTFPYDWRQSNQDTARLFQRFVEDTPALRNKPFDIVAHSMGGLVAMLYIHDHGGAKNVRSLITLGTPYQGSLEALRTAIEGIPQINRAHGAAKVRQVFTSFPALFELMPTYENCCLRFDGKRLQVDVTALESWNTFQWLRDIKSDLKAAEIGLTTAAHLRELTRKPMPSGIHAYRVVGGAITTVAQVLMTKDGRVERWSSQGGDGTVWEVSAAQGDLLNAHVSLHRHSTIFEDPNVKVALRQVLTTKTLTENFSFRESPLELYSNDADKRQVKTLRLSVEDQIVQPGSLVTMTLELFDEIGRPVGVSSVAPVTLTGTDASAPTQVTPVRQADGVFTATIIAPQREGVYRVRWEPSGKAVEEQFFYVAAR